MVERIMRGLRARVSQVSRVKSYRDQAKELKIKKKLLVRRKILIYIG
jgi:hypothetical protein